MYNQNVEVYEWVRNERERRIFGRCNAKMNAVFPPKGYSIDGQLKSDGADCCRAFCSNSIISLFVLYPP